MLKKFKYSDVIGCEFNNDGDCILSINYSESYSSRYPYLSSEYTYDFHISSEMGIVKCYVYEKDFLNNEEKADLYCKISYDKGESLIDSDLIEEAFETEKEYLVKKYPDMKFENWFDIFMYKEESI